MSNLRRRAAELQAAHRPTDVGTRIFLFDASTACAAITLDGDASSSAGVGVGGGGFEAPESAPEVQRMLAEYARKKMAEFNVDRVRQPRCVHCVADCVGLLFCYLIHESLAIPNRNVTLLHLVHTPLTRLGRASHSLPCRL